MLVIRRRAGESLFIGEDVEIRILEMGPSQVKLGIEAPKDITVLRSEVRETQQANISAALERSPETLAQLLARLQR
jgi:carbon storage regulator